MVQNLLDLFIFLLQKTTENELMGVFWWLLIFTFLFYIGRKIVFGR